MSRPEAVFTKQQRQAIARLERAFKACAACGLSFYGMDDEIHVVDDTEFEVAYVTHGYDQYNALASLEPEAINTAHAYKDSGGW